MPVIVSSVRCTVNGTNMVDNKTQPTYGTYHYKYDSGREGDFMMAGFSLRKQSLTVYIMAGFQRFETLMKKLGKYKTGKSCLYIGCLSDVDENVLQQLIDESVSYMRKNYETW